MEQIDDSIKKLVEYEYGDEIRKIERKTLKLEQENIKLKKEYQILKQKNTILKENQKLIQENIKLMEGLEKLSKMPDLPPEAKKIINTIKQLN